ncbi:MAG: nicotinate phosphoribosyltransferase [Malacoplasma sp.]
MDKMEIKFTFDPAIKRGDYSSKYFLTTKKMLKNNANSNDVTLKFFHFSDDITVCGIDECIQLIKFFIDKKDIKNINVWGKNDGEISQKNEPILVIRGDYRKFCCLENIIDGILSRRSSIATNCKKIIDLIGSDSMIFMGDRSDDYSLQSYDGYSAYYGGVRNFVTKKHVEFIRKCENVKYIGTLPHSAIQQHNGSIVSTLKSFIKTFGNSINKVALIDYNNDCLKELDNISNANIKIDYVRIDTSSRLIDKSLIKTANNHSNKKQFYGVNHLLIKNVRNKLDDLDMLTTKIIVSSGLNYEKICDLIKKKSPVDMYGIGKSLLNIVVNYTGDLIKIGDKYKSKVGRSQDIEQHLSNLVKYI